jgi:phosphoenolpyruvate carboxykinase (diphosphate)
LNPPDQKLSAQLIAHINVKLALIGSPPVPIAGDKEFTEIVSAMAGQSREKDRLLGHYLCPVDQRIQTFLYDYLQDVPVTKLPTRTFVLDRPGLARVLSLPVDRDEFHSDIISSYRVKQGVLHNPRSDRRTTQGIFHIAEGGLPIPDDKLGVPKITFAKMLALALNPPRELMTLPFTATQPKPAECLVSLLLRPLVCPEVSGFTPEKRMEVRFFVPGNLVSNLDFVEAIFENGGDPLLPENDSALDSEHWSGHTGCVILAPHLVKATKKSVGLPHFDQATERQRRDGMCWKTGDELYNGGNAFKLCARDESGVIVTLIADNYFGYCKKEVKTQLSFAANLFGLAEEEHAGGALVFASYDLGEEFNGDILARRLPHSFVEMTKTFGDIMEVKPEGYAVDKKFPEIVYVPASARFDLQAQKILWTNPVSGEQSIKLSPEKTYVRPSGYKIKMEKPPGHGRQWRLVGTVAEGTFCHKPCTVSGGGKSEISKPITDAILTGPVFVADPKDPARVEELVSRDYSDRFADKSRVDKRSILSPDRSLGSVIKLLTPDEHDYTPEYNAWLTGIPQYLKELVFVVKRYYKPEWSADWREHFSVDIINGTPGNELKCDNKKLVTTYLRVGFDADGAWRTFGLRKDFHPAVKVQMEDDITASTVVPAAALENLPEGTDNKLSLKFAQNCEQRLFQRPDDAIHRGYDKVAENDFVQPENFFSNYQPLTPADAREMVADALNFYQFTTPMQNFVREVAETGKPDFYVCTASPRLVDGKPTKNPRYLQRRPDLVRASETYLAEISARLRRRVPPGQPLHTPVTAVLPGRRNNPPEKGIRSLACYNPIHFFELPELFMEVICSMTGKSPSTTGAGSEGALTKGPFNALPPIIDLNNALVSFILTGHNAFVTAAGYVGPQLRVDHDVSLIVPEVWCRMTPEERDPKFLVANHFLEKCQDFEHAGKKVLASRLGWRINARFVHAFFGRVFNHPHAVFTEAMLKPELQSKDIFADGMDNILATQKRVSKMYFDDGSIAQACPPLKALLHIMLNDEWEGKGLGYPDFRKLFTRETLLASDWYAARLAAKQKIDRALWKRHVEYLYAFLRKPSHEDVAANLCVTEKLAAARKMLETVEAPDYLKKLSGTLGADPIENYVAA